MTTPVRSLRSARSTRVGSAATTGGASTTCAHEIAARSEKRTRMETKREAKRATRLGRMARTKAERMPRTDFAFVRDRIGCDVLNSSARDFIPPGTSPGAATESFREGEADEHSA